MESKVRGRKSSRCHSDYFLLCHTHSFFLLLLMCFAAGTAPRIGPTHKEKKRKTTKAEETLPTSIMEEETHWPRRAVSPLHHKAVK
eukprot:346559-Pelagomonas_calceolata.AAC.1